MFFAAFFGALLLRADHFPFRNWGTWCPSTASPVSDFTGAWPPAAPKGPQFTPMGAWGILAINTALLLSSGVTVTWAHWAAAPRTTGRSLTWACSPPPLLGFTFLGFQAYEYHHATANSV